MLCGGAELQLLLGVLGVYIIGYVKREDWDVELGVGEDGCCELGLGS